MIKKIPHYPTDFQDLEGKTPLTDEDINIMIQYGINELENNPEWNEFSFSRSDVLIIIDRIRDCSDYDQKYKYEVSVSRRHMRAFVE